MKTQDKSVAKDWFKRRQVLEQKRNSPQLTAKLGHLWRMNPKGNR